MHIGDALKWARVADTAADFLLPDRAAWDPLTRAVPTDWLPGFMWVGASENATGGRVEHYKHGVTRRQLLLDHQGQALDVTNGSHTSVWQAVEWVYGDIEAMGYTRDTPYTDDLIAERSHRLRDAGWTVVYSAPLRHSN